MGTENNITADCTRFELEEAIVACFNVADDLDLVIAEVLEGDNDPDEIANMLIGLAALHKLRCERTFQIFSQLLEDKKIL